MKPPPKGVFPGSPKNNQTLPLGISGIFYMDHPKNSILCLVDWTSRVLTVPSENISGWWLNQPIRKILVTLDHFPKDRGEHEKYLKPPPRYYIDVFSKKTRGIFSFHVNWLVLKPRPWDAHLHIIISTAQFIFQGVCISHPQVLIHSLVFFNGGELKPKQAQYGCFRK